MPCIACSARRLITGGWTRSRSTGSTSASTSPTASASCTGREPTRAGARAAWADGGWRHGAGRDLRRRPRRSKRSGDPRLRARGGLRARRLRLLGVLGRRPGAACPDRRLLARRVARRRGGRRPPAAHGPAGRLRPLPDGLLHSLFTKRSQARNEQACTCRESCWSAPGAIRPRLCSRRTPRVQVSRRRPRWNPPGPASVRGPVAPGQAPDSSKPGPITSRRRTMSAGTATTL